MKPQFANTAAWEQAELLMQPVFIRVIDNLRKALDTTTWKATYRDVPVWAEGVSEETQATVIQLRQQLPTAPPEEAIEIEEALARLPQPFPGYQLCLEQGGHQVTVDLWQLCYQVCFRNYNPVISTSDRPVVEVDASLIDDTGDVDWANLDAKTHRLVTQIFESLPTFAGEDSPAQVPHPGDNDPPLPAQ